jgi:hypothetical protein
LVLSICRKNNDHILVGLLNIQQQDFAILETGWTSLPLAKENLITVRLTMTIGLNNVVQPDNDCIFPACLQYNVDTATRWAYHNAPYTILDSVVEAATVLLTTIIFNKR